MPVSRPDQLPGRDQHVAQIPQHLVGDDWTLSPFELWGASKITLWVASNPVYVQFSRDDPPNPPVWDDPIPVAVGPWSHAGRFGRVRFKNLTRGQAASVFGALYAE